MPPASIGVLTFHRCINYGSYWQARCLVEGLRERGHEAVLLDHQSRRVNRAEWRCALQPIPDAPANREAYAAKARRFFAAFSELPLSRPFPLEGPEKGEVMDLVLVGSDEVWNLQHPWYGGERLFYGEGAPGRRLASYAASFGSQSSRHGLDDHWSSRLRTFDAISVRDRNSQHIVAAALGRQPQLVLDPVLQFAHLVPKGTETGHRYVLVYGHGFPEWLVLAVTDWAQRLNLQLVSVGYDNCWADEQRIDTGPIEFANLVGAAAAVVTNFFHGCVFALINDKPFVTAPSEYRFNKIRDLMVALGAEAHLVSENTGRGDYDRLLTHLPEPTIGHHIASLRDASEAYLDDVLA
jgi:hypothetical protein